jgi:hypothetical protein
MGVIKVLANIGKAVESVAKFTVESIYNAGKYGWDSPREIVKMGNAKRAEADHEFLYQVILYHKGESRLNAIEKLKTQYPREYNKILGQINKDNARYNIESMQPVEMAEA